MIKKIKMKIKIEDKNEKQLKVIEKQGKKQLDTMEQNNELKDDKAKLKRC